MIAGGALWRAAEPLTSLRPATSSLRMKRRSAAERVEEIKLVPSAARPARMALRHSASAAPLRDRQAFPAGPVLCSRCQSLRFYTDPALATTANRTSLKDSEVTFVTANNEPGEIALRSLC